MDGCSSLPELGYGEFSSWLHMKVGSQRIPISGSMEVTMCCNLRCQHCYIPEEQRANHRAGELSLFEIQRILDEITDAGCLWLLLTGGEPFLRKDFLDIYTYAKRKGLITTIFTNGTLITPRISDYLAEWRPFKMEITLYGATQETYERVTGIPGSYDMCRRGIDLLLECNLPLSLKTMVMTLNKHELDDMKSLAAGLGVEFKFDPILNPVLDGSARPTHLRLSPAEIIAIEKADPGRAIKWPDQFRKMLDFPNPGKQVYLCSAGRQGFHIDALGNLSICISTRKSNYDLRKGSFQEGWMSNIFTQINKESSGNFSCLDCSLRRVCPQCPAVAELENGNLEHKVEYLCQVTKMRDSTFSLSK